MLEARLILSLSVEVFFIALFSVWWLALLPTVICQQYANLRRWCGELWSKEVPEAELQIRARIEQRRLHRLKKIIVVALFPVPVLTIYSLSEAVPTVIPNKLDMFQSSRVGLNFEGIAISLVHLFSMSFPRWADRLLTLRFMDGFMMVLFVSTGYHTVLAAGSSRNYTDALNQSLSVQMLLALCLGNSLRVGIVNLINLTIQVALLYSSDFPSAAEAAGSCLEGNMLWRLIWNALFVQLAVSMVQSALRAEAYDLENAQFVSLHDMSNLLGHTNS